jgi:hypothetical protein
VAVPDVAFTAELWEHPGEGGWHFVSVPLDLADEVRARAGHVTRGFGSLRVRATVGGTRWTTSVFPAKDGTFLLPVKKQVRRDEGIAAGDPVTVALDLLDL